MSQVNWPESFDPAKQRAYFGTDGEAVFANIAPEVLAIAFIEPSEGDEPLKPRVDRAKELSDKGHVIDAQIDVWGWGAENTMRLRRLYGKLSVPDAFGTVQILVPPAK